MESVGNLLNELVESPWRMHSLFSDFLVATYWWYEGSSRNSKFILKLLLSIHFAIFFWKKKYSFALVWFWSFLWLVSPTEFQVMCIHKYCILQYTKKCLVNDFNSNSSKNIDVGVCGLYLRIALCSFYIQ